MSLSAYNLKHGCLGSYFDRRDGATIEYSDIVRFTQFSMWRDNRNFLLANLKDKRLMVVVQTDNPEELKRLAKISKQFRHPHRCKISFVRPDLTTNLTDALAALTPDDLELYYRIEDAIDKARAEADKLRKHPSDQDVKVQMPLKADYPAESVARLLSAEFLTQWDTDTLYLGHNGRWNPKTAKLTRCTCMREDGVIKTPGGSCPEHGWMVTKARKTNV